MSPSATRAAEEIWELTIPGRVSLTVNGPGGRPKRITNVGKGSRIRITGPDREIAEEGVRNPELNPFTNGTLIRVDNTDEPRTPAPDELSDEDMKAIFEVTGTEFEQIVSGLSEINIRRLKALCVPVDASQSQSKFIDELIQERWPIGKSTPSYDEMQANN